VHDLIPLAVIGFSAAGYYVQGRSLLTQSGTLIGARGSLFENRIFD